VATLRPFRAYRPLPRHAAAVASRPYDVLNSQEARLEARGNPLSFLHVGKPEIDLPPEVDLYDDRVYAKGHENLQRLIDDGILVQEAEPCFYVYAQTMGDHTQAGFVGCASVQEYLDDTIKKHELTRKDKEDDRTRHVKETGAHTGPIFLTYRSSPELEALLGQITAAAPEVDFVASDGIGHRVWVVRDRTLQEKISQNFRLIRTLYVADGHHRSAAAARVGKEMAEQNAAGHTGEEEYNFFLAVVFPHTQLKILDYNRVVKDLHGLREHAFLEELSKRFTVTGSASPVRPARKGEIGMYLNCHWYRLTRPPDPGSDPVASLEVSLLEREVLHPLLAIEDVRTSKRIDFVGGIRGLSELEHRVDEGEMAVAFALFPTTIDELLAIADAGKIMPPKSTWFEPKLRDGLLVHMLEG
jgi:uncharacterized protein (DUF1015 family)